MNFFQHQDNARRSTRRLVFLFVLAVVLLVIVTNLALLGSLWVFDITFMQSPNAQVHNISAAQNFSERFDYFLHYLNWRLVLKVSGTVVVVIAFVIFLKRQELSGGGKVIAERLGGKKIDLHTNSIHERTILNVVEEMALASGIAVPPVYLLPEKAINAFAAGLNTSDAVIGISKGAIENLNRDQLQGVVAHEFSHIFNGDMRLNINLIAMLEGILFINHTGWFVVRSFSGSRQRSSKNSGSVFILLGFLLIIIGSIGTFFGQLIKAAVSRQREFLADASAVQFTRNPEGIAGALKLIGGSRFGSRLHALHAEEMSHLFFSSALTDNFARRLSSYLATHPALEERIRRIEPKWDGYYLKMANEDDVSSVAEQKIHVQPSQQEKAEQLIEVLATSAVLGSVANTSKNISQLNHLSTSIDTIGEPNEKNYALAQFSLQAIRKDIKEALHDTLASKALMYLLLLSKETSIQTLQMDYLKANETQVVINLLNEIEEGYQLYPRDQHLNMLDLAIPALKEMSEADYKSFLKHLVFLIKADKKIDLFEWLLHKLLVHYLKPNYEKVKPIRAKYRDLSSLRNECKFLLSHLSYVGDKTSDYQATFASGFSLLELGSTAIVEQEQLSLEDLNNAMQHFLHLYPLVKPKLLKACAACIQADGKVTIEQYELLRTISALLDCPMPIMMIGVQTKELN